MISHYNYILVVFFLCSTIYNKTNNNALMYHLTKVYIRNEFHKSNALLVFFILRTS